MQQSRQYHGRGQQQSSRGMQTRTIVTIAVESVQKRRQPSKHYVYVIQVEWSDGTSNTIYRRYSKFFDLQCSLLERFPIEGGKRDPADRIIPFLPGKILFGRSHIREVAEKRLGPIDKYCKELVGLSQNISECQEVISFFEPREEDFHPQQEEKFDKPLLSHHISEPVPAEQYVALADRPVEAANETALEAGETIEVVEKHANGWWFVTSDAGSGWVPSTFLEAKDGCCSNEAVCESDKDQPFTCLADYTPQYNDELKVEKNAVVTVVEKRLDGWWLVRYNGKEGLVPESYLTKAAAMTTSSTSGSSLALPSHQSGGIDAGDHNRSKLKGFSPLNVFRSPMSKRKLPPPRRQSVVKTPEPAPVVKEELIYMTVNVFKGNIDGGLSFTDGQHVKVLEKHNTDWWYVDIDGEEGWAPASYINKQITQESNFKPSRVAPSLPGPGRVPAATPVGNIATELEKRLAGHSGEASSQHTTSRGPWGINSSSASRNIITEESSDEEEERENIYSNIDDSDSDQDTTRQVGRFNKWAPTNPRVADPDNAPKTDIPPPPSPSEMSAGIIAPVVPRAPPKPSAKTSPHVPHKPAPRPAVTPKTSPVLPVGRLQHAPPLVPSSKTSPVLPVGRLTTAPPMVPSSKTSPVLPVGRLTTAPPMVPSSKTSPVLPVGRLQTVPPPLPSSKPQPLLPKTAAQPSPPSVMHRFGLKSNGVDSDNTPPPPPQGSKPTSNKENHSGMPVLPPSKPKPDFGSPSQHSQAVPNFSAMKSNFGLTPVHSGALPPKSNLGSKPKLNPVGDAPRPPPQMSKRNLKTGSKPTSTTAKSCNDDLPSGGVKDIRGMFEGK